MPFHVKNVFCTAKDVKSSGTVYSDVIDTGAANVGDIEPIILEIWSTVNAAGADGRLAISLQHSTTEAFSSPLESGVALSGLAVADLVKGKILETVIPHSLKRYLRIKFITTSADSAVFSTCNITAALRNRG
jgi:hypothetical protein